MPPHFLALPPEIRAFIYRYAITIDECRVDWNMSGLRGTRTTNWYPKYLESEPGRKSRGRPILTAQEPHILTLQRVCKLIRSESSAFLPNIRLHIQYLGHPPAPASLNQIGLLRTFGLYLEGLPSQSLLKFAPMVKAISIGSSMIEDFLRSFLCHDENNDAWKDAWLQLKDPWFFPSLEKFVIFEDGYLGFGPHQLAEYTGDDHDERVEHADRAGAQMEDWLFSRPGICSNLDVPGRTFSIIFQGFIYDYKSLFIEMPPGEEAIEEVKGFNDPFVHPRDAPGRGGIHMDEVPASL